MYGELLKLNVFATSIRDAWYSEQHLAIADALSKGHRQNYELCAKCTKQPNRYSDDPTTDIAHYPK
jgi:hypothetical protein